MRWTLPLLMGLCLGASQAPEPARVSVLTGEQVVQILDETVDWYRTLGTQQQTASQPSDLLILYANQQTADKVIALAFEIARANAELLSSEASSAAADTDANASPRALVEQQKALDAQRAAIQAEIAQNRSGLATAKNRDDVQAKMSELQGELDMVNARRNLLDTMEQFVNESDVKRANASALKAHIDAIAMSVPSLSGAVSGPAQPPAGGAAAAKSVTPAGSGTAFAAASPASDRLGIWDLGANVLKLSKKISTVEAIDRRTQALERTFAGIKSKPVDQLRALSARGDALASEADHANGATLKSVRDQFDTLAWLFQQTSAILIPLSKETVLLQQYRSNLASWRSAIEREYHEALTKLGIRLAVLLGMLAVVFAAAEVWKRAVLRYAHEPRRRYQLLLVRQITTWIVVIAIVGFTFVTELSSFATFAGLLTAGIAVAMQSVLVSIVGYFFLIGKYGIRVGDRVQVGTVSGEVIDLGLVRMHLLELGSQGPLGATGRVVAFANSIVFQSSGGLFKQIAGVNFTWHETTLTLPPAADYAALKASLLEAVNGVVAQYRPEIERQAREIARTSPSDSMRDATPYVQLHFAPGGVEALVRYPVPLEHAAHIDERVSEELLKVISAARAPAGKSTP